MKQITLFGSLAILFMLAAPAEAHRSGCHRWHSCPSDTGSYVCGDLGYTTYCPATPAPAAREISAAAPPVSGVGSVLRYTTTSLNLRRGASSSTAALTTLPKGQAVTLLDGCPGGWCKVQARGLTGYVSQRYLRR